MQTSLNESVPHPPPTLVQYEQPLRVDREDTNQLQTTTTTQKSSKSEGHIEEILNSILPPRYVDSD